MNVPSLEDIPDSYEEFCQDKSSSFLLFGIHPYFRDTFAAADLKEVNDNVIGT